MTQGQNLFWALGLGPDDAALLVSCAAGVDSDAAIAVCSLSGDEHGTLLNSGAGCILSLDESLEAQDPSASLPSLLAECERQKPTLVLFPASAKGKMLAAQFAAAVGTSVMTQASELRVREGKVFGRRSVLAGKASAVERPVGGVAVATVALHGLHSLAGAGDAPLREIELVECLRCAVLQSLEELPEGKRRLEYAKRVVCVGAGLRSLEDMELVERFAGMLGADIAYTRKLTDREPTLDKHRHLGISGVTVRPELYFGIGVSGQAQHTTGMSEAGTVVALTLDPNAPLVAQSDYALVGDYRQVLPDLMEHLSKE